MKYLRSKAKRLSLLALFALALQLGLSFGHCHHEVAAAAVVPAAESASHTSAPDTDHDHGVQRDLCAICASMAMANTAVAASTPPIIAPLTFATLANVYSSDTITPEARRSGFQSRAPPRS